VGYVLGVILVAGLVAFIGWPLLRRDADESGNALEWFPGVPGAAREEQEAVRRRSEQVLADLNELEYDFQMRKISPEDYRFLKARLIEEAAAVLNIGKAQAQTELQELEAAIEAEVAAELEKELSASKGRAGS